MISAARGDRRVPPDLGRLKAIAGPMIGNVDAVVIAAVRDIGPAVILARQDQVELVAAARAHLGFPQPAVGREGQAIGIAVARCSRSRPAIRFGPGQVNVGQPRSLRPRYRSGGSVIVTVAAPVCPAIGLPGAGLPSSVRCRILPSGWLGSCAGVKRCRSPELRNSDWPSGANAMIAPNWPPSPPAGIVPQHGEILRRGAAASRTSLRPSQRQAAAAVRPTARRRSDRLR